MDTLDPARKNIKVVAGVIPSYAAAAAVRMQRRSVAVSSRFHSGTLRSWLSLICGSGFGCVPGYQPFLGTVPV